ncbi:MAG: hypothetical protein WD379_08945 [Dehalococcoidia bacterium]
MLETCTNAPTCYDAYLARRLRERGLAPGAPPPASWTLSREDWDVVAELARRALQANLALEYVQLVEAGWRPEELADGELRGGASIAVNTGMVVRPTPPEISLELEQAAAAALAELGRHYLRLDDAVLDQALRAAATGAWMGQPRKVEAAIDAANGLLRQQEAEREAAQKAASDRPMLTVHVPFRAKGRSYAPGTNPIDPEVADELRDWADKVEASTRGGTRTLGSLGFPQWPVFTLS